MGAWPLWARPSPAGCFFLPWVPASAASPQGPLPFPPWSHLCRVHPHGCVGHADEGGRPALPPRASRQLLDGLIQYVHPWQDRSLAVGPCPSKVAAGAGSGVLGAPQVVAPYAGAWLATRGTRSVSPQVGISQASLSCCRASSTYPWPWVQAGCRCTVLHTSGSTVSRHPGYPLPRRESCVGSLSPPHQLPGSIPRPTGMHQDRPRRSVCWASRGPAGLCAGGSSPAAPGDLGRGESNTAPAVRWLGPGSCSQALCPRAGTLQWQVVTGDGFQRDGVWQPAARYCSLGHDLQETECTGSRTLRGSLMARVDTQTPFASGG